MRQMAGCFSSLSLSIFDTGSTIGIDWLVRPSVGEWQYRQVGKWMDGWMGGWMDGWVDEWVDGWMDG